MTMSLSTSELVRQLQIEDVVGAKALVLGEDGFHSPYFPETIWPRENQFLTAKCPTCRGQNKQVPGTHLNNPGCGFHACWTIGGTVDFTSNYKAEGKICMFLIEGNGTLVVHEKGFRVLNARIIAIVTVPTLREPHANPDVASRYFHLPVIGPSTAQEIIRFQQVKHRNLLQGGVA